MAKLEKTVLVPVDLLPGDRVIVVGEHRLTGSVGSLVCWEKGNPAFEPSLGWGWRIKLDCGEKVFALDRNVQMVSEGGDL
jgi:hypothetical protein